MTLPVALTAAGGGSATPGAGSRPSLVHAKLMLKEPPSAKGSLEPGLSLGEIEFQFNPKELAISKTANWKRDAQKNSMSAGVPQYQGPDPCKMTLEMFLAAKSASDRSVVDIINRLFACCVPTVDSRQKEKPNPPWVIFQWGAVTGFVGYIASVSVKYTLFTPGGLPIRAIATVNLEEMAKAPKGQNPSSGALAPHRLHTVVAGDTLASIAYREYGDPTMWRVLADRNNVDDPMRLRSGTSLLVPAAEDLPG
jgi:hypothetical protein